MNKKHTLKKIRSEITSEIKKNEKTHGDLDIGYELGLMYALYIIDGYILDAEISDNK